MTLEHILINLKRELIRTFAVVDEWFDKEHSLHCYRPQNGGWSVSEVLEHISLTTQDLLVLVEKGKQKALAKSSDEQALKSAVENYSLMKDGFQEIAKPGTFQWHRPNHHAPSGKELLTDVRAKWRDQLLHCLLTLDQLPNGEGALHQTTMTVNNLGKLDVYQYLYFLALHAQRHIIQLKKIEDEFSNADVNVNA
ncbi:DinB family protein [Pseudochryseolinea flava]|uniref:DinB family protein n=1 Tax=Pseudochryseolinea flava TaxID=2059302 RepID=A0A364XY73_9BACT|nr:DinB family protein [Pseudochryseolinea flava]RAV99261.1 DinB family protein [Pseudochryseolinea flava]